MQFTVRAILLGILLALVVPAKESPVSQVVTLIQELKATLEAEAKEEQKSYDKYACWCEKTLERKTKDIAAAKERIEELQATIIELTAKTSAQEVDMKQLEKDIAGVKKSMEEAVAMREKEAGEYQTQKVESEQCIGALEAAVNALSGAGTGTKGLMQTSMRETQLLSIAGSVKGVLELPRVQQWISPSDLETIQRFVDKPDSFVQRPVDGFLQADDIVRNPFGDYAPQSTQIQGILKGLYDSFAHGLEKATGEEATKQKDHEGFIATKEKELETLETALLHLSTRQTEMKKTLADGKVELEDTKVQLEADEAFFAETKTSCKGKAAEWSERSRMRTTELAGINKAIEILSSPEAQKTFDSSASTFVQLAAVHRHGRGRGAATRAEASTQAFRSLQRLATRFQSLAFAELAAAVTAGGHFDEVIVMIDKMIADLREEAKEDIAHRDRCQVELNKNGNDQEDLEKDLEKADGELGRLRDEEAAVKKDLASIEDEVNATQQEIDDRLAMRNEEHAEFTQALKDDVDAVALLGQAIKALTKFYEDNKLPLGLLQQEPEYTVDPDKAPETSWSGSYGGASGESQGIVAILTMLKEDIENEIKTARGEDAEAQKKYLEDQEEMKKALDAKLASKLTLESKLAETQGHLSDLEAHQDQLNNDKSANEDIRGTLDNDCSWVETHFDSRAEKRTKEIEGLQEAKNILAGAAPADE